MGQGKLLKRLFILNLLIINEMGVGKCESDSGHELSDRCGDLRKVLCKSPFFVKGDYYESFENFVGYVGFVWLC